MSTIDHRANCSIFYYYFFCCHNVLTRPNQVKRVIYRDVVAFIRRLSYLFSNQPFFSVILYSLFYEICE